MIYLTALASKLMGWTTFVWLRNVFGHEGSASVTQYPPPTKIIKIRLIPNNATEAIIIKNDPENPNKNFHDS